MSRRVSRASIIWAIVTKDLREFLRNRYWLVAGPLSHLLVIIGFWTFPREFDQETIRVGLYPPTYAHTVNAALALAGRGKHEETWVRSLKIVPFANREQLRARVSDDTEDQPAMRLPIGIAFPDEFAAHIRSGVHTTVTAYAAADVSEQMKAAVSCVVREVAYGFDAVASGQHPVRAFPVVLPDLETVTLGEDRAGFRVPGEKLRAMCTVLVLFFATVVLGGLIAAEIEHRTLTAVLVTPAGVGEVLAAKSIVGIFLGTTLGLIFLLATGRFGTSWSCVTVLVVLGAAMMSAVGMLSGAAGRGFASTLVFSLILLMPLMIPVFAVLTPGTETLFAKSMPSYALVKGLMDATVYSRGWSDLAAHMGLLAAWDAVLLGVGLTVLKRRVAAL